MVLNKELTGVLSVLNHNYPKDQELRKFLKEYSRKNSTIKGTYDFQAFLVKKKKKKMLATLDDYRFNLSFTLLEWCKILGTTIQKISEATSIPRKTLYNIASLKGNPTSHNLNIICEHLKININNLKIRP